MKKIISLICLLIVLPVFVVTADEEPPRIPDGHFIHLKGGKFMSSPESDGFPITTREEVHNMFVNIRDNADTVVVHFHGGLVEVVQAKEYVVITV
jgi:hypothetical protein